MPINTNPEILAPSTTAIPQNGGAWPNTTRKTTMTYSSSTHGPLKIPNLQAGQILIFETPTGFRGHVGLSDDIRRITLSKMQTRRFTVYEVVATDSGTPITGTIFGNENPGSLGKNGKPLPDLRGEITLGDAAQTRFQFAAWRRTAASGQPYLAGLIQPVPDVADMGNTTTDAGNIALRGSNTVVSQHGSPAA